MPTLVVGMTYFLASFVVPALADIVVLYCGAGVLTALLGRRDACATISEGEIDSLRIGPLHWLETGNIISTFARFAFLP
jgi:hypothetical protein